MTSFPDPASGSNALEAGLAAIKQGNYPEAIQQLERYLVTQAGSLNHPDAIKAQTWLATIYIRRRQPKKAIALCQQLNRSDNAKVREWASRTLEEIGQPQSSEVSAPSSTERQKNAEPVSDTGFVPLQTGSQLAGERRLPPQGATQPSFSPTQKQPKTAEEPATSQPPLAEEAAPTIQPSVIDAAAAIPTRNGGRSQRWQPLKKLNPARLQWAEMGTAIALLLLIYLVLLAIKAIQILWLKLGVSLLQWRSYVPLLETPILPILLAMGVLLVASPWLLDVLLKSVYRLQPLSTATLARHSPEAHRLLQRFYQQQRISFPKLGVVPSQIPLSFTYGLLPNSAQIVVSQGLLEQLADDEIAAIYASELGHIKHWDFGWMTWVTGTLQIPYTLYWQAAAAGDWLQNRSEIGKRENAIVAFLLGIAADLLVIVASLSYGLYWWLRWSGLWLSRQRVEYSDRAACNLTGNPNGLIRALLKIATGTVNAVKQQKRTDYLSEGFDLLTPLGRSVALYAGSVYPHVQLDALLAWDQLNSDRHWLTLNNSHPLMGDRLQRLADYARHWQLEPELDLHFQAARSTSKKSLLLQGAPFWGIACGYLIAQILWFVAQVTYWFGAEQLKWLATDYNLFASFMLLGFGLGTLIRFNSFFPDLRLGAGRTAVSNPIADASTLANLLTQPTALPIDSSPIRLEGELLGRTGMSNWLGQDLILKTPTGLIKLHYLSQLGPIGNLLPPRPANFIGQSVIVSGWFRRGATPWIDVDTIRTANQQTIQSGHQIWSTALAISATLLGITLIL